MLRHSRVLKWPHFQCAQGGCLKVWVHVDGAGLGKLLLDVIIAFCVHLVIKTSSTASFASSYLNINVHLHEQREITWLGNLPDFHKLVYYLTGLGKTGSCTGTSHLQPSFSKAPFWNLPWLHFHCKYNTHNGTMHISAMEKYIVACSQFLLLLLLGHKGVLMKDRTSPPLSPATSSSLQEETCPTRSHLSADNPGCLTESRWEKEPSLANAGSHAAGREKQAPQKATHLGICLSRSDSIFLLDGAPVAVLGIPDPLRSVAKLWKQYAWCSSCSPPSASSPAPDPGCCFAEL